MKQPVRQGNIFHSIVPILMGAAGTAVCDAQLSNMQSGGAWNPYLLVAGVILMLDGWISLSWVLRHRAAGEPSPECTASSNGWRLVREALGYVRFVVLLTAAFVLSSSELRYFDGNPRVTDGGEVLARFIHAVMFVFIMTALRKNWLRGVFVDPERSEKSRARTI